jgi:hypothetical protein
MTDWAYSRTERFVLWCVALLGLLGVNGAFLYGLSRPGLVRAAVENPVSMAFMMEALVLMCLLAYLLKKWGAMKLGWTWFLLLSLLASLAFALPVAVLYRDRSN